MDRNLVSLLDVQLVIGLESLMVELMAVKMVDCLVLRWVHH